MSKQGKTSEQEFEDKCIFIVRFCVKAQGCGCSADRVESYLYRIAKALGVKAEFASLATEISFYFSEEEEFWQRSYYTKG